MVSVTAEMSKRSSKGCQCCCLFCCYKLHKRTGFPPLSSAAGNRTGNTWSENKSTYALLMVDFQTGKQRNCYGGGRHPYSRLYWCTVLMGSCEFSRNNLQCDSLTEWGLFGSERWQAFKAWQSLNQNTNLNHLKKERHSSVVYWVMTEICSVWV